MPVISSADDLSDDEMIVFKTLENRSLSSSFIADETGFGKNKVLNLLKDLIERNYVIKIGRGRGTKYSLK